MVDFSNELTLSLYDGHWIKTLRGLRHMLLDIPTANLKKLQLQPILLERLHVVLGESQEGLQPNGLR